MARRRFNAGERAALFVAAGGRCRLCGVALVGRFHADHRRPFARGGPTALSNGQALCAGCNLKKGGRMAESLREWPAVPALRIWQEEAFEAYKACGGPDFLLVATPGSGKTLAALRMAHWLLKAGVIARVVVVVPSAHLRGQWARAAHAAGVQLDPCWENGSGHETADFHGVAVTYQAVASSPQAHRTCCEGRPTLVVLDEMHHAGDDYEWGRCLLTAFGAAARRLCLSGTPFRSDSSRIPFVAYEGGRSRADFVYGYADGLKGGAVRAVLFPHYEGRMEWEDSSGSHASAFAEKLDEAGASRRLRTAVMAEGEWMRGVIGEASERLLEVRRGGHPDAGGLVLAVDQAHARRVADLMRRQAEDTSTPPAVRALLRDPLVAVSDDADASARIAAFRDGDRPWVVAVRMISEGVDVPRLRVGVYATNVVTELFFRQAVGRLVRWQDGVPEQTAYFYIPADARLVAFAREIQEERDHFIGEGWDPEPDGSPGGGCGAAAGFFLPRGASEPRHEGTIHDGATLPPGEVAAAREMFRGLADAVPDHVKVALWRRARDLFVRPPAAPGGAAAGARPAGPPPEQMAHHRRSAARDVRNDHTRSFAAMVRRLAGAAAPAYQDAIQLVNRKLAQHTGVYVADATVVQLERQQRLLAGWSRALSAAAREGRAAAWLAEWEEGGPP